MEFFIVLGVLFVVAVVLYRRSRRVGSGDDWYDPSSAGRNPGSNDAPVDVQQARIRPPLGRGGANFGDSGQDRA